MKKFIKKYSSLIKDYISDVKEAKIEKALVMMKLFNEGKISVKAAIPFYLDLGGRKDLDEEGQNEMERLETERGSSLSEEEHTKLIIQRGLRELEDEGTLDRLNTSFLEKEIRRNISQKSSAKNSTR